MSGCQHEEIPNQCTSFTPNKVESNSVKPPENDDEYDPIEIRPKIMNQDSILLADIEVRVFNAVEGDTGITNGLDVLTLHVSSGNYTYEALQNGIVVISENILVGLPLYERVDIL